MVISILIIAALLGLLPAAIAQSKGRDFMTWWLYGAALFIVALPHALMLTPETRSLEERQLAAGNMRKCPFCAEIVKAEAKICRYCQRDLPPVPFDLPKSYEERFRHGDKVVSTEFGEGMVVRSERDDGTVRVWFPHDRNERTLAAASLRYLPRTGPDES